MFPDVPTAKEIGHDLVVVNFRVVAAPKGIPNDVKDVLAEAFKKAIEDPEFQKLVKGMGLQPTFIGPDESRAFLKKQDDFFTGIANKIGMTPQ